MAVLRIGKVSIHYETYGDGGPNLVFAHGVGGNAASWWQQVPFFVDSYRILTFDHRGFGRSKAPDDEAGMAHFVGDLAAIMDEVSMDSASLVCQSMGGWTGLGMALEHPERVEKLVMSHTPGGISNDAIRAISDAAAASRTPVTSPFGSWAVAPDFYRKNLPGAHLYNQIGGFNDPAARDRAMPGMREPRDLSRLDGYSTPTLFITAGQDQIFPSAMIHAVAELVPGATIAELGDAGHSSYFEAPDLFNETVAAFLAE